MKLKENEKDGLEEEEEGASDDGGPLGSFDPRGPLQE